MKVGREAPKHTKAKFWRVVVATTTEVEVLQLFLMFMSGSHSPGKIPKPCQICISS